MEVELLRLEDCAFALHELQSNRVRVPHQPWSHFIALVDGSRSLGIIHFHNLITQMGFPIQSEPVHPNLDEGIQVMKRGDILD